VIHGPARIPLPGAGALELGRHPLIMGILNVNPDSFSDGGDFVVLDKALSHASEMAAEGADILDIGGESTRPGAEEVSAQTERDRVMPVLHALAESAYPLPISIDTYKAAVARDALSAGAKIVNDVHGLQRDPEIAGVAAAFGAPAVVMHWDKDRDTGKDLIAEMLRYFEVSLTIAERHGLARERLILDPGFGFAKSLKENYTLLNRLYELLELGIPLLIGTSRKSMIGRLLDNAPKERLAGTLATTTLAYTGGGQIFRVHDVRENRDALRVAEATLYGAPDAESTR